MPSLTGDGAVFRALLLILVLMSSRLLHAQDTASTVLRYRALEIHDELTWLVGYHHGAFGYGELGIGRNMTVIGHFPVGWGYYAGAEMRVDQPEIMGLKVGAYVTSAFAMGLQMIQYVNGPQSSTVLRPEIGIGVLKGKMTYAYNIGLSAERLAGINSHMISFTYAFRVARFRGDDRHRSKNK